MRVDVVSAETLGQTEVERWSELQRQSVYRSPFFRPELTLAVAEVLVTRVAVIEDAGRVVGFFPFQARLRSGRPIAWPRSDYHGPVLDVSAELDPRALVRACRLATWTFDHLPAELAAFAPYSSGRAESPALDLSDGFESYLASRSHRSDVRVTAGRTTRKLEREVGPLRLVPESDETGLLELLFEWKRRQYIETGVRDVLADGDSRELLERMLGIRTPDFAGTLTVLYAGNEIAALLLGLRTADVWHDWFPVYNQELRRYSPGIILLLELARNVAPLGIREIDLGKGEARYKLALANRSHELMEGCVGANAASALPSRLRTSARLALRRAGVHRAVRRAIHGVRR
jgi:CelD/BcsL family acetyltransferase involved in cellulose biosynthesis